MLVDQEFVGNKKKENYKSLVADFLHNPYIHTTNRCQGTPENSFHALALGLVS